MTEQQFDIEELYGKLRCAILENLRQEINRKSTGGCTQQPQISCNANSLLPDETILPRDEKRFHALICRIYHELYLERIIIPGTANLSCMGSQSMEWMWYQVTDYGRRFLQTSEYSPYDPDGYLRRLKLEISDVDEIIFRYVEESLKCLRMDCLLAAAVTIRCASEKAMLLLIEQFGQAIIDPKEKRPIGRRQITG